MINGLKWISGICGIASLLLTGACNCCKQSVAENPAASAEATSASPSSSDLYRLVVSFYSIGSGVNREAREKFTAWIGETEKKYGKPLDVEITPWGREGEVDYCIRMSDYAAADQKKIVDSVNELLKSMEYIHVNENAPCLRKRKGR
jgi:hypothetical protein